jgi:biofilm protein TabA
MIVATLKDLSHQVALTPAMQTALDYLNQVQSSVEPQPARVEIDGKRVYALYQDYETIPSGAEVRLEAHRQYIDIQYIASGEEMMAWAPVNTLQNPTEYNPDKDVFHGTLPAAESTPVRVSAGQAAIFFPEDAHAPKLACAAPTAVHKIVIKVQI